MASNEIESPNLTSCDSEPIHIPGSVQPHGVLMVLHPGNLSVMQISANSNTLLGCDPHQVIGNSLDHILEKADADSLTALIKGMPEPQIGINLQTIRASRSGHVFNASAHRIESAFILELEPADERPAFSFGQMYARVIGLPELLLRAPTLEKIGQLAVNEIRQLGRFDRVVLMKFATDWAGHVIAESKADDMGSFLNLWFPATDIPTPARKLYEINRVRIIPDSSAEAVALVPHLSPLTGNPVDLSLAALRSVHLAHLEYMRNMDVGCSMSMSILGSDGRLWGLIVCHHREPQLVSLDTRMACEIMVRMLGSQIEKSEIVEHRAVIEREILLRSLAARLLGFIATDPDFVEGLTIHPEELLSFAQADGAAIVSGGRCTCLGICPDEPQIWKIVDWMAASGYPDFFNTDRAHDVLPNGAELTARASGILAIGISKTDKASLIWFRPELVTTVRWGGDPRKPGGESLKMHPRKSFEVWHETIKGRSRGWSDAELDAAFLLRETILSTR